MLTDNDLVANSYPELISPTTNLLRTLGQAGLNGEAQRSSSSANQFWTGITNLQSAGGYEVRPACQEITSGPFWGVGSIVRNIDGGTFGVSNSITKVPRVGSAEQSDVLSTKSATCTTTRNVVCISY